MKAASRLVSLLALCVPSAAFAARIDPSSVNASSTYPPEQGVSYEAEKAADKKVSTSWVEGEDGSGLGSWLEIDLGGDKTVTGLRIWGGLWYSGDYWKRGTRPKEIEVIFADDSKETFTLKDEMKPQDVTLAKAKKTSKVRIKVKSVYTGTTWFDTAISEVQVFDAGAAETASVGKITASTTLPADADGSYDPSNVNDGVSDTMWCEGNKSGDGSNEWLDFTFNGTESVSKITVINGIGTSMQFWMKGNRAASATLRFSDGSTESIELKNSFLPQTIGFSPRSVSGARLTFNTVVKGKEFNDLCISEAYFSR